MAEYGFFKKPHKYGEKGIRDMTMMKRPAWMSTAGGNK
jgi:hypothetical protein